MNRLIVLFFATPVLVAFSGTARAELCKDCRGKAYTEDTRECVECKGWTRSGMFKLCPACGKARGECERCRAKLKGAPGGDIVKTPAGSATEPATKPAKIDADNSGQYKSGKWEYRLTIFNKGTRSERRAGQLLYDGKEVAAAEGINDHYATAWGRIYWAGNNPFGASGWVPAGLVFDARPGKELPPPAGAETQPVTQAGAKEIELGESSSGKTVEVASGAKVVIRLAGNITTGYSWMLAKHDGNAVELVGRIEYVTNPGPSMPGKGGTFVATFKAVQAGKSMVTLEYKRPWEKDKPALKTFTITIDVKAAAPAEEKQGITGKVLKLKGDFMPGPEPAKGTREPLPVPVWVFKGTVKVFEKPDPKHPSLIKTVQADKDGTYRVGLPPGEYTVVAEIDGKLYLNRFTGDGNWATVKVEADKWTTFNIEDTSGAAF